MAKESVLAGTTSHSVNIFIQDSSSTIGAGLAALVFNTSGLVASYTFTGANATRTAITLATLAAVNSAFSSGGFKEIDATNMKGGYRLDIPNAALAAASGQTVTFELHGATNMAPCWFEIELTATNNQDGVRGGMTALPNAAVSGVGGLLTAPTTANVGLADLSRILGTALTETAGLLAGGFKKFFNIATPASTMDVIARVTLTDTVTTYTNNTPQTGDTYALANGANGFAIIAGYTDSIEGRLPAALVGGRMDSSVGAIAVGVDLTATMKTSVTTAATAATPTAAAVTATVNADVKKVNGVTVNGDGNATPWGP